MGQKRKCPGSRGTSVLPSAADIVSLPQHVRLVPTAEEHHSHCDASQRRIYWRPSAVIEGTRYEPKAVNSGRQKSMYLRHRDLIR